MTSPRLLPDPYKILGVDKDATLPQIRLAHRKLILQCHPDKVQDPKLKAIKVDEFQKVQEAYEILSDVSRRSEYDQTVKLQKLREELGKTSTSTPTPTPPSTSKTYEYNVRTAEPRPTTFSSSYPKASQKPPKESNVYSKPPPRSYEDLYEEPAKPSVRRSRTTTRDSERDERDRRRHQEEDDREKLRRKMEKEAKRGEHGDRKKSREKDKRRGPEEKVRTGPYVEESSEDEYRRKVERAARRADEIRAEVAARQEREARDREHREREHRERERELRDREREREREREPPALKDSPMGDKYKNHMANAARYVQASRRDSEIKPEVPFAPAPPEMPTMRRADTMPTSSPYNIRYETARPSAYDNHSDDEAPRRSSAARPSRRSAETPSKSKDAPKLSRRSTRDSPFVNTTSTSPPTKPTLQKQYSEPPIVGVGSGRREPSRSKTEYPREPPQPPPFARAATYTQGMSMKEDIRDRGRGPSKTFQEPDSESDSGSNSESPSPTPQYSHVRQPRREVPEPTGTTKTYVINNGRIEPKNSSYRSDLRDDAYTKQNRSPSDGRTTRPPLTRSGGSSSRQARSQSRGYHTTSAPESAEPIVLTAQPPKSREPSRGASRGVHPPKYSVHYAPPITPDSIVYTTGTQYVDRRTTDSGHHRDYPPYSAARGHEVY
ncbi:hypothetical protein NHQ30_005201 [Ciborinia camelliae]|nr:hypothetical protein NHQ30_005201 [Ciborinia camelliae]